MLIHSFFITFHIISKNIPKKPSLRPSLKPSFSPTDLPSLTPSAFPSDVPSSSPTSLPSPTPTSSPSYQSSPSPTSLPSSSPSASPTSNPSSWPSAPPSLDPCKGYDGVFGNTTDDDDAGTVVSYSYGVERNRVVEESTGTTLSDSIMELEGSMLNLLVGDFYSGCASASGRLLMLDGNENGNEKGSRVQHNIFEKYSNGAE